VEKHVRRARLATETHIDDARFNDAPIFPKKTTQQLVARNRKLAQVTPIAGIDER
jgi:hypothetical protein